MKLLCLSASLLCLFLSGEAQAQESQAPSSPAIASKVSKWESEIAAFESADQANPPPQNALLFIGSSSIRLWKEVSADFPQHQVLNRGFGGSVIADSVAFIPRIVLPYAPRQIFFYAGGNDINAGKKPEVVAADFRAFATQVHATLPATEIAFISIAPNPKRWLQNEQVKETNRLVEAFCHEAPHLQYIDVYSKMLGPDGQPREGIYREDGLHMNRAGYQIWIRELTPYLPSPDKK